MIVELPLCERSSSGRTIQSGVCTFRRRLRRGLRTHDRCCEASEAVAVRRSPVGPSNLQNQNASDSEACATTFPSSNLEGDRTDQPNPDMPRLLRLPKTTQDHQRLRPPPPRLRLSFLAILQSFPKKQQWPSNQALLHQFRRSQLSMLPLPTRALLPS
jgi:hypothetical protein